MNVFYSATAVFFTLLCAVGCLPLELKDPRALEEGREPVSGAPLFAASPAKKICQLTGEWDAQLRAPTSNKTLSRFHLWGTDLGPSFEHDGKMWILFGDSLPENPARHPPAALLRMTPNLPGGDAVAFTSDTEPGDCIDLEFLVDPDRETYKAPRIPGIDFGDMNVPLDGISAVDAWHPQRFYLLGSTDEMSRSFLAVTEDNGESYLFVRYLSNKFFVNISAQVIREDGIDQVYLFGGGEFRKSHLYLAKMPLERIENETATRYFSGVDGERGAPLWSRGEADAVPVFKTRNNPTMELAFGEVTDGCIGEFSVHYSEVAGVWLALYNCGTKFGWISMRAAYHPWGPWSNPVVLFDPVRDGGYCHFIFRDGAGCDSLSDPGRADDLGAVYGPYVMERYTTGSSDRFTLYFVMSTWNPYNVMVMSVELSRTDLPTKKVLSE